MTIHAEELYIVRYVDLYSVVSIWQTNGFLQGFLADSFYRHPVEKRHECSSLGEGSPCAMVSTMMVFMKLLLLFILQGFAVVHAGPREKAKGQNKGQSKDAAWGRLARQVLGAEEPPVSSKNVEAAAGASGASAAQEAPADAMSDASSTGHHDGEGEGTEAALRHEADNAADNHEQPLHMDVTSDLTEEQRQLLSELPNMQNLVHAIEGHDWRNLPDEAFMLTRADIISECLVSEGFTQEEVFALARETRRNVLQPQQTPDHDDTAATGSSSSRVRCRTPRSPTGWDSMRSGLLCSGLCQDADQVSIHLPWLTGSFETQHFLSMLHDGGQQLQVELVSRFLAVVLCYTHTHQQNMDSSRHITSNMRFLRWRARCYVRKLPNRYRNRPRRCLQSKQSSFLQPFSFILLYLTVGILEMLRTCLDLVSTSILASALSLLFRSSTRSGPKSRGTRRLFLILVFLYSLTPCVGVRVVGDTMPPTEVTSRSYRQDSNVAVTKPHGRPLPASSFSQIRKRSFKRACRRAMQQGQAWYRGRWFTRTHFSYMQHSQVLHEHQNSINTMRSQALDITGCIHYVGTRGESAQACSMNYLRGLTNLLKGTWEQFFCKKHTGHTAQSGRQAPGYAFTVVTPSTDFQACYACFPPGSSILKVYGIMH